MTTRSFMDAVGFGAVWSLLASGAVLGWRRQWIRRMAASLRPAGDAA